MSNTNDFGSRNVGPPEQSAELKIIIGLLEEDFSRLAGTLSRVLNVVGHSSPRLRQELLTIKALAEDAAQLSSLLLKPRTIEGDR